VPRYRVLAAGELVGYVELPEPQRSYSIASGLLEPVRAYDKVCPTVRGYTALFVQAFEAELENDRLLEAGLGPCMSAAEMREQWLAADVQQFRQRFTLRDDHGDLVQAKVELLEAPPEGSRVQTLAAHGRPSVHVTFGPRVSWLTRVRRALARRVNV
jgi:hypothetical protein